MNKRSVYIFILGVINGFVAGVAFRPFSIAWIAEVIIYSLLIDLYTKAVSEKKYEVS